MADARDYKDGSSSLVLGADSYTMSTDLNDREYVMSQNCVCRGGIVQTRPGTAALLCLPDGNFQGFTVFTPSNGVAHLVAAVDGKIYVSPEPFDAYYRLWNLQFNPESDFVAWCSTLKSTTINNDGELVPVDNPYSVLIIQDQNTRAAYWDGSTSAHLNPAPPDDVTDGTPVPGYNQTPIGLWMIWSGNRLWVSNGNQIYASDLGDPLSFTEGTYIAEGRSFSLSGPCTGMIEVPAEDQAAKGFIAFTENDGTMFQSYIQDRTVWLDTPLFQNTILPNIGCVAPRSLVTQYGLNWWFSPRGLTNLNAAVRQKLSSRIDYQDNQMFASKAYLGPELSGICAGYYENYLVCSVPSGDVKNRHTWVLDQAPFDGNANAWTGIWTGWNPVEWGKGNVNGSERVFFGSIDYDGKNRVWEAFLPERTDNGCRITCYLQTREHAVGSLDQKRYEWTKIFLSQIYGRVDLNVYVASTKGSFQLQKNYVIEATEGQIYADQQYSEEGSADYPLMIGNRFQTRTIRTPSDPDDDECNACGVESQEGNMIDYAFSHLLVWSGQMGVRAYQMHMRESPERDSGDCEENETGPRVLNEAGCSGLTLFVDGTLFEEYSATAEGTATLNSGQTVYIQREVTSPVSEAAAQANAECSVRAIENQLVGRDVEPGVYDGVIVNPPEFYSLEPAPACSFVCVSEDYAYANLPDLTGPFSVTVPDCVNVQIGVDGSGTMVAYSGTWNYGGGAATSKAACIYINGVQAGCIATSVESAPGSYPFVGGGAFDPGASDGTITIVGLGGGSSQDVGSTLATSGPTVGSSCTDQSIDWYGRIFNTANNTSAQLQLQNLEIGSTYDTVVTLDDSTTMEIETTADAETMLIDLGDFGEGPGPVSCVTTKRNVGPGPGPPPGPPPP